MAETWKPIDGFEGLYEVSDLGRVRSLDRIVKRSNGSPQTIRGRIRKTPPVSTLGYASLFLCVGGVKTFAYVHHLVARAFIGPRPPGKEVAHSDGDGMNAALSNLRYATPVENDADKIRHGTRPQGTRNGQSKLSESDVRNIRQRRASGEKGIDLAAEFKVSDGHIAMIYKRRCWRHL